MTSYERIRKAVKKKYPDCVLVENKEEPSRQRWFLFRSRNDQSVTGDLLGCGMTIGQAYKDAYERITS